MARDWLTNRVAQEPRAAGITYVVAAAAKPNLPIA